MGMGITLALFFSRSVTLFERTAIPRCQKFRVIGYFKTLGYMRPSPIFAGAMPERFKSYDVPLGIPVVDDMLNEFGIETENSGQLALEVYGSGTHGAPSLFGNSQNATTELLLWHIKLLNMNPFPEQSLIWGR